MLSSGKLVSLANDWNSTSSLLKAGHSEAKVDCLCKVVFHVIGNTQPSSLQWRQCIHLLIGWWSLADVNWQSHFIWTHCSMPLPWSELIVGVNMWYESWHILDVLTTFARLLCLIVQSFSIVSLPRDQYIFSVWAPCHSTSSWFVLQ